MKKLLMILTLALVMVSLLVGCSSGSADGVLTVGDMSASVGEGAFVLREMESMYENQYGSEVWEQVLDGVAFDQIAKEQAMESLKRLLVSANVAEENGIELDEQEEATIEGMIVQYMTIYPEEVLTRDQITEEDMRRVFVMNALGEKIMNSEFVDFEVNQVQLAEDLADDVTYQQIEKYGTEGILEQVTAQYVLIRKVAADGSAYSEEQLSDAKVRAEEVYNTAIASEDADDYDVKFDGLVADYSEDPNALENGGVYTYYRGEMLEEVEDAAFAMEEGSTEFLETEDGYYIIRNISYTIPDEEDVQSVEDYKAYLVEQYTMAQQQALYSELYEEWVVDYNVEVNEAMWATVKTSVELASE